MWRAPEVSLGAGLSSAAALYPMTETRERITWGKGHMEQHIPSGHPGRKATSSGQPQKANSVFHGYILKVKR